MKCQRDMYGEPTVCKSPGWVIRIYRPILADEERDRRMEQIARAAAELLVLAESYNRKGD